MTASPLKPPRRPAKSATQAATPSATAAAPLPDPAALAQAIRALLEPMAELAIARGLSFSAMEEMLKTAFVDAARAAHPTLPGHRLVSRVSTATGINRREVTRITQAERSAPVVNGSPATRLFTKWVADPDLRTRGGAVRALPRSGPAPSFEALAHSVTRDVHPRSLLDELCRLGLARLEDDTVHLVRDSFVPGDDSERLLGFVGANVGDHLRAAVANVLLPDARHLEQAIFAEMSPESVAALDQLMRAQWKSLLASTVPAIQTLIDADRSTGRPRDQRVRVGLYNYHETTTPATEPVRRKKP